MSTQSYPLPEVDIPLSPCRKLMEAGRWLVPPAERPVGWQRYEKPIPCAPPQKAPQYVLRQPVPPKRKPAKPPKPVLLTPKGRPKGLAAEHVNAIEIRKRLAEGKTTHQVADEFAVSVHTVYKHLRNSNGPERICACGKRKWIDAKACRQCNANRRQREWYARQKEAKE